MRKKTLILLAETYQAVGSMLSDLGQFNSDKGIKLLDNLSRGKLIHKDILPWPSFEKLENKRMTTYNYSFTNSTMLSSCDYNTDDRELTVTFNGGKSYTYVDVEKEFYDSLINAPSAGKFFNAHKASLEQKK